MQKIAISLFIFLIPTFSFATLGDCFTATGFSETQYNGDWEETGTYNGFPSYTGGRYGYSTGFDGRICLFEVASPTGVCGVNDHYYNDDTGGVLEGTYSLGTIGSGSGGTITSDTCPSPPSPTEPTQNSGTTTEALLGSIAFGQAIIIVVLFIGLCGYIYNTMNKKKPWHS